MKFHDYLEYKCIDITRLSRRLDITRRRLSHETCPFNLTYIEVAKLKDFVGDWDTYEIKEETDK